MRPGHDDTRLILSVRKVTEEEVALARRYISREAEEEPEVVLDALGLAEEEES